jgi:Domain of Unknown Function (DUF748)
MGALPPVAGKIDASLDPVTMRVRGWLALAAGLLLAGAAVTLYFLPQIARSVAVGRIHALTGRTVSIAAVELSLLTGRFTVHGFRLGERDGSATFAEFERLDGRLHLPALLVGHLRLRELALTDSTVRVVRLPGGEFNLSDLVQGSDTPGRPLDVTVDRFALTGGRVTLEDQALPESRTWTSEQINIEAHDVSTRGAEGRAIARSVTAGAPVAMEVTKLRLYPVHLQATVTMEGVDLTPLRVYFPPEAPIALTRGRASTTVSVMLDARDGLRADATGRFEDLSLEERGGRDPLALVPTLTVEVTGFGFREGELQLSRLAVDGRMSVRDPSATQGTRYPVTSLRARVSDLTWPATTPGLIDVRTSIPGGGTLALAGTVRPPPDASQLQLKLASVNLAPWTQLVPLAARITGLGEADLRVNEPLAAGIPTRVQGWVAINRLRVADADQELLGAQRIEARGMEVHWPSRVVVDRVFVNGPRATIERDRDGRFPLTKVSAGAASGGAVSHPAATPPIGVEVGAVVVRNGHVTWHDQAVSPPARLSVSNIEGSISDAGWPLRGPLGVRTALRPPGGGQLQVTGQIGVDPVTADLRVVARNAELAPYQPYLPTTARLGGAADLDVAVAVPSLAERRATVRGRAGLSRVDVRDGERTVARIERAAASDVALDWPERLDISRLALTRPWLLIERDNQGGLALRTLLTPSGRPAGAPANGTNGSAAEDAGGSLAVTVGRLSVDDGGIRIVDRAVTPAFAVDLQPATLRVDGLSTQSAAPARVQLTGRVGAGAELALRGSLRVFGGPLHVDVDGELREFAMPRTNPYLLSQVGWQTREGRLTTKLRCRIDGDTLSARTDVRLSRLQLARASNHDEAQARIGLPLGLITTLMKNRDGDITLSFPVGGRLSDPQFDFREAIWSAIRSVAVNAITLPVSWIGRVHFSQDSKIESIEVDPIPFEPGTAVLTPDGAARLAGVVAFLDQLPAVKMALNPGVSAQDLEALRRKALDAAVNRLAREERLSPERAAARLFTKQFGRPAPDPEATLAALLQRIPAPTDELRELTAQRLETVRAAASKAGIDPERLAETGAVQRDAAEGQVALAVLEPETQRSSKLHELFRKLGVPLKASEADK